MAPKQAAPKETLPDRQWRINGDAFEKLDGDAVYDDNLVISSHYTLLNFIPKNLYEQFQNVANVYFLFVGILQMIEEISTTDGRPDMYQPLAIILLASAARAAIEDKAKHEADAQRNGFKYARLGKDGWDMVESGALRVGNIIRVNENNMIPADLLFIGSSRPKGHCEIDKANLNGETALEVYNAFPQLATLTQCYDSAMEMSKDDDERVTANLRRLKARLEYEPPHASFFACRGKIRIEEGPTSDPEDLGEFAIDGSKYLLMRETSLRNTPFIYGIVLYTGDDTAIQMSNNSGEKARVKVSRMVHSVNLYLRWMLLFQVVLCLIGGFAAGAWAADNKSSAWYVRMGAESPATMGVLAFFTWFIILAQMVPISLIVSSEIVKFAQSFFIQRDLALYYEPIDKPTKCNNSTIHEDLGLIDYIFSDKTGTLTQNKMVFRYASVMSARQEKKGGTTLRGGRHAQYTAEYGSQETAIAVMVKKRKQELEDSERRNAKKQAQAAAIAEGGAPAGGDDAEPEPHPIDAASARHAWMDLSAPLLSKGKTGAEGGAQRERGCCYRTVFDDAADQDEGGDDAAFTPVEFTEKERLELMEGLWAEGATTGSGDDPATKEAKDRVDFLHRYMRHMALSNTVEPYDDEGVLRFKSSAAEETAMVQFAMSCGFTKSKVNPTVLDIQVRDAQLNLTGEVVREEFLNVATCGFTSQRARVTLVYKEKKTGIIHVMTKGQDTVCLPLMELKGPSPDALRQRLADMSTNGMRVLVAGFAELPSSWWEGAREEEYLRILNLPTTSHSEGHSDQTCAGAPQCERCVEHAFYEKLEKDAGLEYLGIVGMEDQLQLLVPEAINEFLLADIKVWMITGDKLGAAKTIGLACNLIDPDMQATFRKGMSVEEYIAASEDTRLLEVTGHWATMASSDKELGSLFKVFDADSSGVVGVAGFRSCLRAMKCGVSDERLDDLCKAHDIGEDGRLDREQFLLLFHELKLSMYEAVRQDIEAGLARYARITDHERDPVSILVNRDAFLTMFPDEPDEKVTPEMLEELRDMFFHLASVSKSVVFAQAKPSHKKKMVTEIMARVPGAVTLAIGDGANDTNMIRAAHVGVGISGIEGTAAVNSADYAIGTFRMLHTLLFVHGFWNYHRLAKLVVFIFYKAVLVAVSQYYFGFFSGFSGQQYFNNNIYNWYNVFYTALPILIIGVFDQTLPYSSLENTPSAYRFSKGRAFNAPIFFGWVLRGLVHGLILFFVAAAGQGWDNDIASEDGTTRGLWYTSTVVFTPIVLVPNLIVFFLMHSVTVLSYISIFCGLAAFITLLPIFSVLIGFNPQLYGVVQRIVGEPTPWLVIIIATAVPLIGELVIRFLQVSMRPKVYDILRERLAARYQRLGDDVKSAYRLVSPHHVDEEDKRRKSLSRRQSAFGKFKNSRTQSGGFRERMQSMSVNEQPGHAVDHTHNKLHDATDDQRAIVRSLLKFRELSAQEFDAAFSPRRLDIEHPDYFHNKFDVKRRSLSQAAAPLVDSLLKDKAKPSGKRAQAALLAATAEAADKASPPGVTDSSSPSKESTKPIPHIQGVRVATSAGPAQ